MKKTLFSFLFLISIFCAKAQNCSEWIETKYDEFTGITINSMKDRVYILKDGSRKVALYVAQKIEENGEKEIIFTIDIRDGGCINNFNGIIFLFTDGSKLKETNHGSNNCEGFAMLNIGIADSDGNTIKSYLEKKKVKSLRVYTNDSFVQVEFTAANQEKLIKTLKCID